MEKGQSVVKRTRFSWVSSSSLKLQVALIFIAILMVVVRVFPLGMQKRIVNEAIILKKFDLLLSYCLAYLLAVAAASALKYLSVIIQTQIGQQAMADMRKKLYSHIISLPLDFFRKTQPGLVVNSLVSELNVPSNFVGMAIAVTVINILTLLAFAGYLFSDRWWMCCRNLWSQSRNKYHRGNYSGICYLCLSCSNKNRCSWLQDHHNIHVLFGNLHNFYRDQALSRKSISLII